MFLFGRRILENLQNARASGSGNGGAWGITARGQIYMGAPIGVVEINSQLEIAAPVKVPPLNPNPPCSATLI